MEKLKSLKVVGISGGGDCELENYGCMRDVVKPFSYEFFPGNVYAIIGECGNGGWALSTLLAGKNNIDLGSIYLNQNKILIEELKKISCYVGTDSAKKKYYGLKPMSVKEQIEYGIRNGLSFSKDIEEIKSMFGLSDERFGRPIKYLGVERWRASIAIGYAFGKTVYCFPWLNTKSMLQLEEHIKLCLNILIKMGGIIIIPTTKEEVIKRIAVHYVVIDVS